MSQANVSRCIGVESDSEKCSKAMKFISSCCAKMASLRGKLSRFYLINATTSQLGTIIPHPGYFFTFWQGWNPADKIDTIKLIMRIFTRKVRILLFTQRKYFVSDSYLHTRRGFNLPLPLVRM